MLAAAYGVDLLVSSGEIPRNTVVAGVDIGGLTPAAAADALERDLAPRVVADHTVVAADVEATLSPATAGIELDVDGTVDAAAEQPLNPWTRIVTLFSDRSIDPEITGDETALAAQIETIAAQVDRAPVDATIVLENTTPSLVEPADGRVLDREGAAEAITGALASGGDPATPIDLPVDVSPVRVDTEEAQRVLDETVTPALAAPVTVTSADGATSAEVPVAAIAAGLTFTPQDDGELVVAIDPAALQAALGDGLGVFGTPAEDARFEVSGGAVSVVASVDGTGVDPQLLSDQLLGVLTDPAPRTVTAELGPVPADFTTEEANALGITEEISSFTTNFTSTASGTNIRVVAEEVDGALVLPGETFSLNTFTGPRGTAQGYVPANVISGGEISTAVGGGISQFATTMFNAVFFAGLEDVYHKPHSFYISRYPAGREATVYEGVIDLVWTNDTDTGVFVDTNWVHGRDHGDLLRDAALRDRVDQQPAYELPLPGRPGEGRRRRLQPAVRRRGLRHHRDPGLPRPDHGRGDPAGGLPHQLRRRGRDPLRAAAGARARPRRHDPDVAAEPGRSSSGRSSSGRLPEALTGPPGEGRPRQVAAVQALERERPCTLVG